MESSTSEGSKSEEKVDSSIGKSWSPTPRRFLAAEFKKVLDDAFASPPGLKRPENTFGKKKPASKARSSNLERFHAEEIARQTGKPYDAAPLKETWNLSLPMCTFAVTVNCAGLAKTIYDQWLWSGLVQFSGAEPQLESLEELGKKPVYKLTLKIRTANFGTVIETINMLSSMNLEVASVYPICSDGWTDIRVSLKLKDPRSCCKQPTSG